MLDLLDWMAETTKYRSRIADIFSIFLNVDKVYDFLLLPAVLIIPQVIYPLPSTPSTTYPSNPASPDEPLSLTLLSTSQPPTITTDVAPSILTGSQLPISSPEVSQPEDTQELPPFSSFLSDVRPLLSRPNQPKLRPDPAVLGRQHCCEYYTNHARRTRRPRFNQQLQYCLQPEFCKWEIIFWDGKRQEYTIQNTSLPSQRLVVPPQAITALPH